MQKLIAYSHLWLAVVAWLITVILVINLLGGDFADRSCQTACMQVLYGAALITALLGFGCGIYAYLRLSFTAIHIIAGLALLTLLGILLATPLIGSF